MPDTTPSPAPVTVAPAWNPDAVFAMLADPARRRALVALARGGPQPATSVMASAGRRLDATLKHLIAMREAGVLTTAPDPTDGRRTLYGLSPKVQVTQTPEGAVLDFGCCVVRL
jgi:DNA-binding transcriptional ArsR family regulator